VRRGSALLLKLVVALVKRQVGTSNGRLTVAQEALQQNLARACAAALLLLPQRFLEPRLYATIAGTLWPHALVA